MRRFPQPAQRINRQRLATDGVGLPVRRLSSLSSLPCLRSAWLRVRWLRGLRRLLPIVGAVPLVLS